MSEWIEILRQACERTSQPKVCKALQQPDGFPSPTVISQALNGKYPSQKGLERLRDIVEGYYLGRTVECPVLGDLARDKCRFHQARPFAATNPQRVRLFQACRDCQNRRKES